MSDFNLVDPFYLHFMNANILTVTAENERVAVRELFRRRLPDYDDATLRSMLVGGWRSSKVAAWAIAARGHLALLPDVARQLLSRSGYDEHCCICLASLGSTDAVSPLMEYLLGCADGAMQRNALDETVSPHWALAALQTLEASAAVPATDDREALWKRFLERQEDRIGASFVKARHEAMALLPRAVDWLRGLR